MRETERHLDGPRGGVPADDSPGLHRTADHQRSPLEVVLLGTAAGPPPLPDRAGISSALVVDGATYIVDCGRSAVTQFRHAGLNFADVRGVFITHLHSDHFADYYNFFLLNFTTPAAGFDSIPNNTPAYGPGRAGGLPPASGGRVVGTVNPDLPTPGLVDLTNSLHEAFAYSTNIFLREVPVDRDIRDLVKPHDIELPADVDATALGDTAPPMDPFVVMEDDRVRVSAILVPHGRVFPSFAYRFDTDHGSVTFSGDTSYSDNVVRLARSCNMLVHEAISMPESAPPELKAVLEIHTSVDEVGTIAERADVPHLVLSHLIDFETLDQINAADWATRAKKGYSGRVTIGEDLMSLPVIQR